MRRVALAILLLVGAAFIVVPVAVTGEAYAKSKNVGGGPGNSGPGDKNPPGNDPGGKPPGNPSENPGGQKK